MTDSSHVDLQVLGELKEIMEDEFLVLLETYLSDSVKLLAEIDQAINSSDAEGLRSVAHSLKGSSANLGAIVLSDYCKQLEDMGKNNQLDNAADVFSKVREESVIVNEALAKEIEANA